LGLGGVLVLALYPDAGDTAGEVVVPHLTDQASQLLTDPTRSLEERSPR
jgi:hypothetical protein